MKFPDFVQSTHGSPISLLVAPSRSSFPIVAEIEDVITQPCKRTNFTLE